MTRHLCLALALLTLSLGGVAQAQAPSAERAAADFLRGAGRDLKTGTLLAR